MVTLWRRARAATSDVEDAEWLLLGLEILGVVGGVFLAFQLNSWVADRQLKREQTALVERLFDEAKTVVGEVRSINEYFAEAEDRQTKIISGWSLDGSCPSPESWNELAGLSYFGTINPPSAAYNEMLGSGGLTLLPSGELRRSVSAFHAELDNFNRQETMLGARVMDVSGEFFREIPATYDASANRVVFAADGYPAACADPVYRSQAVQALQARQGLTRWRRHVLARAIHMCQQLATATGSVCTPSEGGPLKPTDLELLEQYSVE